jgi:23S rRNA pseudouridine1911/1915/1917 synthase
MPKKKDKIRLHKKITDIIQNSTLTQTEYTKPEIQRNIENYGVFVNKTKVNNRLYWVLEHDLIDFSHWPKRAKGDFQRLKIIQENKDFLILFKPKNLVVQPGAGHQKDNLISWLEEKYPEQKQIDSVTRGLVHRLDKDTQGLILIAKHQKSLDFLQNQFRNKTVKKSYLAIVEGIFTKNIKISNWQTRSKQNPIRQIFFENQTEALNYDPKARYAESIFYPKFVCPERNLSLIEAEIKTGRMHQIRLQAEAVGFPLFQDKIYNKKGKNQLKLKIQDGSIPILKQEEFDFENTFNKKKSLENFKNKEKSKNLQTLNQAKKLSWNEFQKLWQDIFQDQAYSLLSNNLVFETLQNKILEITYYKI